MVTLLLLLQALGLHQVETRAQLDSLGWPSTDPQGVPVTVLNYGTSDAKAAPLVPMSFMLVDARGQLQERLGQPLATPAGEAWLFAFDDEGYTGFAISVVGENVVVVREWRARRYRNWNVLKAKPITLAFMNALRQSLDLPLQGRSDQP